MVLQDRDLAALADHAAACWPEEACALLVGQEGPGGERRVLRVEVSRNIAEDRTRFFEIDPGLRIRLERELRGQEHCIIGVWHSHPGGPAAPSDADARMVIERQFIWLISAVQDGKVVETNAFSPSPTYGFDPTTLTIITGD
nr:M67 family metallopeptidase [Sneathiella chinensis]